MITFDTKNNYLTEKEVGEFLKLIFRNEYIIQDKRFKDCSFWPDYQIPNLNLIVEFDGYGHFITNKAAIKDDEKVILARNYDYKTIRIPFFFQLTKNMIYYFFKIDVNNDYNNYQLGFIDKKATLPSEFSYFGYMKFLNILKDIKNKGYEKEFNEVCISLKNKCVDKNHFEVFFMKDDFYEYCIKMPQ